MFSALMSLSFANELQYYIQIDIFIEEAKKGMLFDEGILANNK